MIKQNGVTLIELLVAVSLISVVFVAVTGVYISAKKVMGGLEGRDISLGGAIAIEHMSRNIGLGNRVELLDGNKQVTVRWDYNNSSAPLNTPNNFTDDRLLRYRFFSDNTLRFQILSQTGPPPALVAADASEVEPGLRLAGTVGTDSKFTITPDNRVQIDMKIQTSGTPPEQVLRTVITLQGCSESSRCRP
jgi:prepilin-type N-terminal cleavage/methylation domain-containing protein